MLYKSTLWYEIYTGRKINWKIFNQYFDKNGNDEKWYIYYIEHSDGEPWFELHAHIDGDIVVSAEPFKAEVYGGHGRPIVNEKSLNSTEKKYAIEIFNQCFIDRVGDTLSSIVDNAIANKVTFNGYSATKRGTDYILFISPEGKNIKLQNKNLIKALDYSHITLDILRDSSFAQEFAKCIGITVYEPLFAVLQNIDPTNYLEYEELERKYRYNKLKTSINNKDIDACKKYTDVLENKLNDIKSLCQDAICIDSEEILRWIIDNSKNITYDLCSIIALAVKYNNENIFYYLLDSGMYDPLQSNSTQWDSPIYVAAYNRGHEKFVLPLLERGFSMPASVAYPLYEICSLDDIAEFLPYNVTFNEKTILRIYAEDRKDIIEELEKKPLRYCNDDLLLSAYIHSGNFEKFSALLEAGYTNNSTESFAISLFKKAYSNSSEWTNLWLQHGYDVNIDNARLLHDACDSLDVEMAIYLIEHGANPQLKGKYSQTVFERVVGFHGVRDSELWPQKTHLVKYLLSYGINPIEESITSPSILERLIGKSEEFDLYLIDWLADNNCINSLNKVYSYTFGKEEKRELTISYALSNYLTKKYNPKVLRYFIEKGARLDIEGYTDKPFVTACEICDLPEIKLLVSVGANINEFRWGRNALYRAVEKNRSIDIIKYLIEIGLDCNDMNKARQDGFGNPISPPKTSVLDVAEQIGNSETIEYLKSCGALHASDYIKIYY